MFILLIEYFLPLTLLIDTNINNTGKSDDRAVVGFKVT